MSYPFIDDEGNVHNLDFEQMIEAKDGFYQLDDGTWLRRVRGDSVRAPKGIRQRTEIISDSMGFIEKQLPDMQKHLKQSGVRGVEFIRDKTEPKFFQVKCDSPNVLQKYLKSRQMADYNTKNGSGAMLSEQQLADAKELVLRK